MSDTDRASDSSWSIVDVDNDFKESDDSDVESLEGDFTVESIYDSDSEVESNITDNDNGASDAEEALENELNDSITEPLYDANIVEHQYDNVPDSEDEEVEILTEENDDALNTESQQHVEPVNVVKKKNDTGIPFCRNRYLVAFSAINFTISIAAFSMFFTSKHPINAFKDCPYNIWDRPLNDIDTCLRNQHVYNFDAPTTSLKEIDNELPFSLKPSTQKDLRSAYRAERASETRKNLYKRASRQLFASKFIEKEAEKVEEIRQEAPKCGLNEVPMTNLTRAIIAKVSNWTVTVPVVQNLIHLSPSFNRGVKKVSSWFKSSHGFSRFYDRVQKQLPPVLKESLQSMPSKIEKFAKNIQTDFGAYARKAVTTALAKTSNLSTKLAHYKRHPFVSQIGRQVRSALARWSKITPKSVKDVCFVASPCVGAAKFASSLEKTNDLSFLIGRERATEYIDYLRSLATSGNCSASALACERFWWTGCSGAILKHCNFRQWQRKRFISATHFLARRPEVKSTAIEIGWIPSKDRRSSVRCVRSNFPVTASPLPCPAIQRPFPTLAEASVAPCQSGPFNAKPCQQSTMKKTINKPRGNGRPNWWNERAAVRAAQRRAKSSSPVPPPKSLQRV